MNNSKAKKILLTGGGTGGSVSPLLAVAEKLRETDKKYKFLWIGTYRGIEKKMVEKEEIEFRAICSGKLRRYFSIKNFIDPFLIIIGFFQALAILIVWRPNLVMSAGSFVNVPIIWAAWILRIPILIHQQDIRPGLANKLMAPLAKKVTVTFKESLNYYGAKAIWIGNPVRLSILDLQFLIEKIKEKFSLKKDLPVVLIIGGGTGAMAINRLVRESIKELSRFCQVILITGKDKISNTKYQIPNIKYFDFLDREKITEALQVADIVISRAGLGMLTELSYLGKPTILIPMPSSHQEENAKIFKDREAAIVLNQNELTNKKFTDTIKRLLDSEKMLNKLKINIKTVIKKGANQEIINIVKKII